VRPTAQSRFPYKVSPIGWDPSGRSGYGLVEWMMLRRRESRTFDVLIRSIVPEPIFTRFKAADDGVT